MRNINEMWRFCCPPSERKRNCRAFTLIEILVVAVILTVLVVLLLPAVAKAIGRSQDAACAHNLRTVANGFLQFASDHNGFFFTDVQPGYMRQSFFPYLGVETNTPYKKTPLWCPRLDPRQAGGDNHIGVTGPNNVLGNGSPPSGIAHWPMNVAMVPAPSKMWIFTETARMDTQGNLKAPVWALSDEYFTAPYAPGQNDNSLAFPHTGRKNFVFLDGHLESLSWPDLQLRMYPPKERVPFFGYIYNPYQ